MGKGLVIIGSILIIFAIFIFVAYNSILGSSTTPAFLFIESGDIEVDKGNGYEPATDEMQLKTNYKIKTTNGKASIVFYESEVMQLEQNAEVSIEELSSSKIKTLQNSGETWNTISKLTGQRTYEVETPTTVATVRGTAFGVTNDNAVIVGENSVEVCSEGDCLTINVFEKANIVSGVLTKLELTNEEREWIKEKIENNINILKKVRNREIAKNQAIVNRILKAKGFSQDDLSTFLDQADQGIFDLDQLIAESPVKSKALNKVAALTKEIIRLNNYLKTL